MSGLDVRRIERLLMEMEEAFDIISSSLSVGEESFLSDIKSIYAVRYAIVKIVETASLMGAHILEIQYGIAAETYSDIFEQLGRRGVISPDISDGFRRLVGLRNLIVRRYWVIDDSRIYREATGNGLKIIREFIERIRRYVKERAR